MLHYHHPPPLKKNKQSYADFLAEFAGFVDDLLKCFANLLESVNIIQHVQVPTHIDGHTIDLI